MTAHAQTLGGLLPATTYHYRVRSRDATGNLASSGDFTFTTAPAPPAAPSNLVATASSASEIVLTWTDNASNEDGFFVERCQGKASRCTSFVQIGSVDVPDGSLFADSALQPNTFYTYRVRAYNLVGTSDYSNIAQAKTTKGSKSGGRQGGW